MPYFFSILTIIIAVSLPLDAQAQVDIPSCDRMEKFFLSCKRICDNPNDIQETFGVSPRGIRDSDINTIETSVFECALRIAPGQYARHNIDSASPQLDARNAAVSLSRDRLEAGLTIATSVIDSQDRQRLDEKNMISELSEIIDNIPNPANLGLAVYSGLEPRQKRHMIKVESYLNGWRGETSDPKVRQLIGAIRRANRAAMKASYLIQIDRIYNLVPSAETHSAASWIGLTNEDETILRVIRDDLRYFDWGLVDVSELYKGLDALEEKRLNTLAVKSDEELLAEDSELPMMLNIFHLTAKFCMKHGVAFDRVNLEVMDLVFNEILSSRNVSDPAREMGKHNARRAFEASGARYELTELDCIDLQQDLFRSYGIRP